MNAPDAIRPDPTPLAVPTREEDLRGSASRPQLDGYRLHEPIWQSQAATVWLATDLMLKLPVAIKEYLPVRHARRHSATLVVGMTGGGAAFDVGLQAFLDEARTLARAEDRSLLRVIRLFQANGTAYRVMPHAPGPRLLDACASRATPFDEATLRALLERLLDAVQAWHAVGGVHGRVAPDNVLMLAEERPLLLGPGAASAALGLAPPLPAGDPARAPHEDDGADVEWPAGPWVDVHDVARVGRFCLTGEWDDAGRNAGSLVERFGASPLLAALDAAASPLTHRRAQSVAQLRRWLVNGPAAYVARGVRDGAPAETARPQRADAAPAPGAAPLADGPVGADPSARPEPGRPYASTPEAAPNEASEGWSESAERDAGWPATEPEPQPEPTRPMDRPFDIGIDESALHWSPLALERRRRGLHAWLAAAGASFALIAVGAGVWIAQQPVHIAGLTHDGAPPVAAAERRAPGAAPAAGARADEVPATAAVLAPTEAASAVGVPAGPAVVPTPAAAEPAPAQEATAPGQDLAAVAAEHPDLASHGSTAAPPEAIAPITQRPPPARAPAGFGSPREACAGRTEFSLYRCMQTQCAKPQWSTHEQCVRLREMDAVH
jgi:non-specific serine/threonine protein kinase